MDNIPGPGNSRPDSEDSPDDPVSDKYSELKTRPETFDAPHDRIETPATTNPIAPVLASLINQSRVTNPSGTPTNVQRSSSNQSISQKAKKQRKTHIVGTASARKRLEPVGQEKIDTSLQTILSDLPEDEVPPGDETDHGSTIASTLVSKIPVQSVPTIRTGDNQSAWSETLNDYQDMQTENNTTILDQAQELVAVDQKSKSLTIRGDGDSSEEDRSAWEKRQQRELYESDESEDFHTLGASQLELNRTGQGASVPINWNENFAMEKTGWEGWNEKPLEESSRRELNWDDWRMDSDKDSKKLNHPPVISDDLIV
ncbi:hypothetical protein PGT21_037002 [Puccinia graminis f. sp. tritici]|uniref:Uncharacterized protein n=1 Tax=Puccinia graminis f. sp. tritici TaxID=56615 RepID=A0A5B0R409_PUCGR|nr:hypothetical protein PGT21_037002 [Puccinia graminis f. sp. tritici]